MAPMSVRCAMVCRLVSWFETTRTLWLTTSEKAELGLVNSEFGKHLLFHAAFEGIRDFLQYG